MTGQSDLVVGQVDLIGRNVETSVTQNSLCVTIDRLYANRSADADTAARLNGTNECDPVCVVFGFNVHAAASDRRAVVNVSDRSVVAVHYRNAATDTQPACFSARLGKIKTEHILSCRDGQRSSRRSVNPCVIGNDCLCRVVDRLDQHRPTQTGCAGAVSNR